MSAAPNMIAEISVLPTPAGTAANKVEYIEAAIAAIADSGLTHSVHALGTTIEGSPDEVWATARAAFDACLASGADTEMMMLKLYQGGTTIGTLESSGQAVADAHSTKNAVVAPLVATPPSSTEPRLLHEGSVALPPLIEMPGYPLPLEAIVKPPDADTLWQWQESKGMTDADSSWASVWPAAASLAAHIAADPALVRGRAVVERGLGLGSGLGRAVVERGRCCCLQTQCRNPLPATHSSCPPASKLPPTQCRLLRS